jgi:hypothetical protein
LEGSLIPVQDIVEDILSHRETLKDRHLKGFFLRLKELYGNEIIEYKEVNLRFDRFFRKV